MSIGNIFVARGGVGQDQLIITAKDGSSLTITDIRLIVDEFELEPVEVTDCDAVPEPPECADFEARFFFIDVPLGADKDLTVVNEEIPVGTYDELEFEVEDLEVDADDPEDAADAALIAALLSAIRDTFPDWPAEASMLVVGSYTPAGGGTATSFSTYFEAEIEVEFDIVPPLEITETGGGSLVVDVSPDRWFIQADGSVLDLSALDFTTTGQIVEFELEIEDGFDLEIET